MRAAHFTSLAAIAVVLGAVASSTPASGIAITLGDQDYADGALPLSGALFDAASAGEPFPFDGGLGDDNDTDFSASWSFNFAPASYGTATMRLGIFDHDSASPGSQVAFFGFDTNDLTALLDGIFEASGGEQGVVNVYDVPIPAPLLGELDDGLATFTLTLEGITLSSLGVVLPNNSAGLDFSQLLLDENGRQIPVPASLALLASALASLVWLGRRRNGF